MYITVGKIRMQIQKVCLNSYQWSQCLWNNCRYCWLLYCLCYCLCVVKVKRGLF